MSYSKVWSDYADGKGKHEREKFYHLSVCVSAQNTREKKRCEFQTSLTRAVVEIVA